MMELSQPGPRRVYCVQDTYPKWSNTTLKRDRETHTNLQVRATFTFGLIGGLCERIQNDGLVPIPEPFLAYNPRSTVKGGYSPFQSVALLTDGADHLQEKKYRPEAVLVNSMAGCTRLELATSDVTGRRSNQLS